jgi:hypothetical protein
MRKLSEAQTRYLLDCYGRGGDCTWESRWESKRSILKLVDLGLAQHLPTLGQMYGDKTTDEVAEIIGRPVTIGDMGDLRIKLTDKGTELAQQLKKKSEVQAVMES